MLPREIRMHTLITAHRKVMRRAARVDTDGTDVADHSICLSGIARGESTQEEGRVVDTVAKLFNRPLLLFSRAYAVLVASSRTLSTGVAAFGAGRVRDSRGH